jgi:hypothetical protein
MKSRFSDVLSSGLAETPNSSQSGPQLTGASSHWLNKSPPSIVGTKATICREDINGQSRTHE